MKSTALKTIDELFDFRLVLLVLALIVGTAGLVGFVFGFGDGYKAGIRHAGEMSK